MLRIFTSNNKKIARLDLKKKGFGHAKASTTTETFTIYLQHFTLKATD